jgi:hypothetical protein
MKILRTYTVFPCLLFIFACNQNIQPTKGDSKSEKKIDNGGNSVPSGTNQSNTPAKHLLEPSADTVFVSSCTRKIKADGIVSQTDQNLSMSGKAAAEVMRRLALNGKFTYCADQFITASASDSAKAMIEDMSGSCVANESIEAKFSLSERCPPPQTGEQSLKRNSHTSNGVTFSEAYRTTVSVNGATAEEKKVLKGGWFELFKSSSPSSEERMLTSDLK